MNPPNPSTPYPTYGSVCSGIEAPSAAWHPLGWKPLWFSEIEPFPKAVLAHRYPEVPDLGDMTTLPARILAGEVPDVDVFVGGTPCQSFSVAGLRLGLADPRGQLTRTYVEIIDALDTVRLAKGKPPTVALWENVPGVLSDKNNAFGNFLGALCGEDDALLPAGPKWTNAGSVLGPRRALAWRVLDAQYFGVAQRRRRVFLVASARAGGVDPVEVLLVEQGVSRNPPSRGEAGQGSAPAARGGAALGSGTAGHSADGGDGGRGRGVAASHWDGDYPHPTLNQSFNTGAIGYSNQEIFSQRGNGLVPSPQHGFPDPAYAVTGGLKLGSGRSNQDTFITAPLPARAVFTGDGVLADPIGANEANTYTNEGSNNFRLHNCVGEPQGKSSTFVAQAIGNFVPATVAGTLVKHNGAGPGETQNAAYVVDKLNDGIVGALTARGGRNAGMANDDLDARRFALQPIAQGEVAGPLDAHYYKGPGSRQGGEREYVAQAKTSCVTGDRTHALTTRSAAEEDGTGRGNPIVNVGMAVRRLTPVECERLQGFPDGYTAIPWRGKLASECPDGPRYKALGNSMAVPVIRWLGVRIGRSL